MDLAPLLASGNINAVFIVLGATDISIILRPGHHLPSLNKKSITEFQQSSIER